LKTIFHPLLVLLANLTDRTLARQLKDVVRQLQFVKAENEVLRAHLPERVVVTPRERRRLIRLGKPLGTAITGLITLVTPGTFLRWLREAKANKEPGKAGRRRRINVRKLVIRLARENPGWGYTRVLGELRKLTSQKVSRQFVANVMREHGFDPGPHRGEKTWDEFLKIHAATLWQCDFFAHKVLTLHGVRELFVIAFLRVGSRKIFVTKATEHPTAAWVKEQAEVFAASLPASGLQAKIIFHDRDTKFGRAFDDALRAKGIEVRRSPVHAPNICAYVERWIQSIETECLNHFVVLGEKHFNYLVSSYVNFYLKHRPHQGLDNKPLDHTEPDDDVPSVSSVRRQSWLGGLLKHYSRKAA
jgi:putative transposase